MPQINLGRVEGRSIKQISRVGSEGLVDTYEALLDDNTPIGQFTVTNGKDGINGSNGRDGVDGAPGADGTRILIGGQLVESFDADTKLDKSSVVNNLNATTPGSPLDAVQGKALADISKLKFSRKESIQIWTGSEVNSGETVNSTYGWISDQDPGTVNLTFGSNSGQNTLLGNFATLLALINNNQSSYPSWLTNATNFRAFCKAASECGITEIIQSKAGTSGEQPIIRIQNLICQSLNTGTASENTHISATVCDQKGQFLSFSAKIMNPTSSPSVQIDLGPVGAKFEWDATNKILNIVTN